MAVVDGMGGHAHGARAAEVTVATLKECFAEMSLPVFDPQGFLTLALARAHDRVVKLGDGVALDHKPRATCAVCLVQDGGAFWAHVGDSRIYQLRGGAMQCPHARSQPRRAAAARRADRRKRNARTPDAQLRRVLSRRRRTIARHERDRAPQAGAGRRAARVHRRAVVRRRGQRDRETLGRQPASLSSAWFGRWQSAPSRAIPLTATTRA